LQKGKAMKARVLYVDDNPDDAVLVELAFRKAGVNARLETAADVSRAKSILSTRSRVPACVLLDLKLGSVSGFDLLAWIRKQPGLASLPVVVLTSSLLPGDVTRAYALGANSFLTKPPDLEALIGLVKVIEMHWLQDTAPLPGTPGVMPALTGTDSLGSFHLDTANVGLGPGSSLMGKRGAS